MDLTAVIKAVPEGYIGWVEEVPGAHTQGKTCEEVLENLKEAVRLVFEAHRELSEQELQDPGVIKQPLSTAVL
jgi:predicted RNase H-like HicB family nuclease